MSHRVEEDSSCAAAQRSEWRSPTAVLLAITVVTLLLSLLGYGYALAVESMFGLPEASFSDSPLDYLRMSSHVIAQWVTGIADGLGSRATYVRLYGDYSLAGAGLTLVWLIGVLLWRFPSLRRLFMGKAAAAVQRVRSNTVCCAFGRWLLRWRWPLLSLGGIWGWLPVGVWVLAGCLLAVSIAVSAVPLMGYVTGQLSLTKWVVKPDFCTPIANRQQRLKGQPPPSTNDAKTISFATCVQIRPDEGGGTLHQGRMVVATAKWVVLFDPTSGAVWRVSADQAQIALVGSLDKPTTEPDAVTHPSQAPSVRR
jgi:hypothetical protein